MRPYTALGVSIVLNSAAVVFLRALIDAIAPANGAISFGFFLDALANWLFWAGTSSFVAGTYFWMHCLKVIPLSVAYPTGAASYVIVGILAHFLFAESVSTVRVVGMAMIIAGVILLYGRRERSPS